MWNLKLLGTSVLVALLACAGSAWYAYSTGKSTGALEVQTKWDAEKLATQAAQAEEQMKARQTEQALQAAISRIRTEKQREAVRLAADYAAVIDSLHDRAETRAGDGGVPQGAALGVGCTGAGLARPDAEFLAGYSRDAGRLQLALQECRAAYSEVERQLNGAKDAQ
jgi:hypothetical protein